ncbi:metallophosphoesterase [Lapidilactobacillus bayanensis]|uniref:metallophosphoesterase n=1 Tax=Lapidilactobacillus bayanensis TaxID=2485998 RepID=UPI000F7965CC|nr:metallophosphoesterase [Lapidilactobacillus bayanensis]
MKLVVVSDSHGDEQILQVIVDHYQGQVDALIHCGDSELSWDDPLRQHFQIVQGNMDFDQNFPLTVTTEIAGQKILVVHGHRYGVNFGLEQLALLAQEQQADLVFYGHTHQLACAMNQQRLFLNPGSISQPRGRFVSLRGTYAVVEVNGAEINVQYYQRNLQPVPGLNFQFTKK